MRRVTSLELLDGGLLSQDEIDGNLADLWRANRYLGGISSSLRLLNLIFRRTGKRRVRVLEVGAGDGRLAARLRRELRRQRIEAEFFVLDLRLGHLVAGGATAEDLHPVAGDVLSLPFAKGAFDVVTCNHLLHHFSDDLALRCLRNLARVAREAVLINDIERHWLPYLLMRLAPWIWRARVSRLDSVASIRQAYTCPELAGIATAGGFTDFEVHRMIPYRLGLLLWKSASARPDEAGA
jgi:SAM-dependent methyltransferase